MTESEAERGAARADLCRFLAACYYEPGSEFAEEGLFESMRIAAGSVDPGLEELAVRIGAAFSEEPLEDLLVDYARLFLGPVDALAKPYGSVWLEEGGTLMRESTMAVARLYEQGGFEIAGEFRELPDHIAAELEFLYLLVFQETAAIASGDVAAWATASGLKRRFLDDHLGAWVSPFARAVMDGARSDYFREIAALTERFVRLEAQRR